MANAITSDAITASGLRKAFGRTRALDDLALTVRAGEVHGLLGPNGAGKTTLLRVLLGLVRADSGVARVLAADPWREAAELHRRVAYVPGEVTLWPTLTGGEVIGLLGELRGGARRARVAELVERFELDPTKRCRTYSSGNRRKVALVAALASDAELLVLDEPTAGLDPLMQAVFEECVARAREDGRTVLLASHILAEVEKVCDRVSIVRAGRVVDSGTLSDLRHLTRTTVRARLTGPPNGLAALPGVHDWTADGDQVRFRVDGNRLSQVLHVLTEREVRDLVCQPPTLEELFLGHYGSRS
ncbi:ABC transporter ATP-binding protein [Actinokineospora auranticolor]|uniref:ABC-2 type transport system ATP-binding protein n=1 Tax=Actinokineospora auranticolor TaxID=155976 RepID=A0A2S6GIW1_9PSEU|nr:ABC transporter ATP-binding protein [Actinokineospora auranticolor]PPK65172.1 ABC-2 type transport system ATP-binding protein [Actinokineospora auranticolor]